MPPENRETPTGPSQPGPLSLRLGKPVRPGDLASLGPYRIVRELGRGGMGAVFLAFDSRLDREVALKVMLPGPPDAKQRFLREAHAAAIVVHDNVVDVYEADEIAGVPYLAMPLLRGQSLEQRLADGGKLEAAEIRRIGVEAARGLAAAHERGLVHRDIKPANIWLEEPGGRVKLLDFGLARPADAPKLTQSGALIGTPAYRLATGVDAFPCENFALWAIALQTKDAVPVRERAPALPGDLADLIDELLARDPDDRPATAEEVAGRLTGRGRPRWHWLVLLLAAGVGSAGLGVGVALATRSPAPQPAEPQVPGTVLATPMEPLPEPANDAPAPPPVQATPPTPMPIVAPAVAVPTKPEEDPDRAATLALRRAIEKRTRFRVEITFTVKAVGKSPRGRYLFLNSKAIYTDPDCITAVKEFPDLSVREAKYEKYKADFEDRAITVIGWAEFYEGRINVKFDSTAAVKVAPEAQLPVSWKEVD
jgi:hypothetical protein